MFSHKPENLLTRRPVTLRFDRIPSWGKRFSQAMNDGEKQQKDDII